ncbi:MAG: B12-binding domain-containing radical SAM protein [Candidatus Krumholzibacteria bacterium]|nr:B12-binding domain-containing radical SAM protein [Candidatus Krumholzibacteria bacterium]
MKALLIYPDYPDTFWGFRSALKLVDKKASEPPLGLLTVAALLPADWDLKLIDIKVDALDDSDIQGADLVFISAMSIQKDSAKDVIARCRRLGVKTVAGGPLFTTCPEDFPEVDHLVLGEAEITLAPFLEDLANGAALHIYRTDRRPAIRRSPLPRYDLIDIHQYATMDLQYSRGCPFDCEFCDITSLFGHKVRTKSTSQVLRELQNFYAMGWRGTVFFVDDNFIGDKVRLKQDILPAIIEFMKARDYPFGLSTQLSINLADDPELMQLMREAGFAGVFVGIETPHEGSLAECGKVQNEGRDLLDSVARIQKAGLEVKAGFIIGFDSDPNTIFEQISQFIAASGIVTAMVGLLNAPRGTRLYQRLSREGRLRQEATGDNTDCSLNFVPKMNPSTLISGYKQVLKSIYSAGPYYDRVGSFLKKFTKAGPRRRLGRIQRKDVIGLFRSIYTLGLRGNSRRQYWRLFFETLFLRPQLFSLAMTYAVYGHHFRSVYREHL